MTECRPMPDAHQPIRTLEEWDALDDAEVKAGFASAEIGDPEPGPNHTRSYHHGWRWGMFDREGKGMPFDDMRLLREVMDRDRVARGEKPRGPWGKGDA